VPFLSRGPPCVRLLPLKVPRRRTLLATTASGVGPFQGPDRTPSSLLRSISASAGRGAGPSFFGNETASPPGRHKRQERDRLGPRGSLRSRCFLTIRWLVKHESKFVSRFLVFGRGTRRRTRDSHYIPAKAVVTQVAVLSRSGVVAYSTTQFHAASTRGRGGGRKTRTL
jgi:hypothetical protein